MAKVDKSKSKPAKPKPKLAKLERKIKKSIKHVDKIQPVVLCNIVDDKGTPIEGKQNFVIEGRHRLMVDPKWTSVHLGQLTMGEALAKRTASAFLKEKDAEKNMANLAQFCEYLKTTESLEKGEYVKRIFELMGGKYAKDGKRITGAVSWKTISKYTPNEFKIETKPPEPTGKREPSKMIQATYYLPKLTTAHFAEMQKLTRFKGDITDRKTRAQLLYQFIETALKFGEKP